MEIQGRISGSSRIKKKEPGELIILDSGREKDFIKEEENAAVSSSSLVLGENLAKKMGEEPCILKHILWKN